MDRMKPIEWYYIVFCGVIFLLIWITMRSGGIECVDKRSETNGWCSDDEWPLQMCPTEFSIWTIIHMHTSYDHTCIECIVYTFTIHIIKYYKSQNEFYFERNPIKIPKYFNLLVFVSCSFSHSLTQYVLKISIMSCRSHHATPFVDDLKKPLDYS